MTTIALKSSANLIYIHLSISSLSSYTDNLKAFFSLLKAKVNILHISKNRIPQKNLVTNSSDITTYNIEHTSTELSTTGTVMFISKDNSYILHKDLQIYSPKELESIFLEIIIPNKFSSLLGTNYKHSQNHIN